jgi:hypothetical protein
MEDRLHALVVYLIICSTTGRVHSSENHKRFLLDDGTDMNEKVFQMEHEIQSLKSTMQELVEVAKRTGTCSCQGNFNLFRFFYVLTPGVNMLKATSPASFFRVSYVITSGINMLKGASLKIVVHVFLCDNFRYKYAKGVPLNKKSSFRLLYFEFFLNVMA